MAIFSLDIFNIYKESDKAYLSYLKPEDNSGLSKPSSSPEYFSSPLTFWIPLIKGVVNAHSKEKTNEKKKKKQRKVPAKLGHRVARGVFRVQL